MEGRFHSSRKTTNRRRSSCFQAQPSRLAVRTIAMGPFYCPIDQKVYLDTSFFEDLERRFRACDAGSKTCQFSQAYVIAHEIGHHVQNQLGILTKVRKRKRNGQGRRERASGPSGLQADCLAGVGRTALKQSGNSSNQEMSSLPCRPLQLSAMIVCSDGPRVTWCPTHSPTAPRHNASGGL